MSTEKNTQALGAVMMATAVDHGSLEGVMRVDNHFPDLIDHMDHKDVLNLVEYADSLNHAHIAEYIASRLD